VGRKIALGAVAAAGAAAFAFLVVVMVRQGLDRAAVWAAPLAALVGIVAAVAAVSGPLPLPSKVPLPPELEVPDWVVGRPSELAAVVTALVAGRGGTVGITTGLFGAGGFGKTTLARMVCADRRVRRHFGGRVYFVTVGRDMRAAAIAAKVNEVIKLVFDKDVTFTDPQLAGQHLGALLDAGPSRLLVLDDVWEAGQLAPFTEGGKKCARLVTTRVPELLAGRGTPVRVDQMSREQARALLTGGLPPLDEAVVAGLLAVTGRWPLLLRLASKILADYARVAPDVSAQGAVLVKRLRAAGPAVVDELLGATDRGLDVGQPGERAQAVRATIGASTSLLDHRDAERFTELGVFAEDESIAFRLVAQLWRATAGLDDLQVAQVCARLAQLALVSQATGPGGGLSLHDVVRDFLRAEIGRQRLGELNDTLLNAAAADLPVAEPLDAADGRRVRVAWWELDKDDRYLWGHLIEHLRDAGRGGKAERAFEADEVATDLRWVGARLEQFGPAAPAADLAAAGTPRAARLRAVLERAAHLLAPTEPTGAVVDVLHSRVADDPTWGTQVDVLRDMYSRPRLVNRWPLPDVADPALRRVLTGHGQTVRAVAVAPDGSWLVSAGQDQVVRFWAMATGQERATLTGHTGLVVAVAVAPDGSWLATGSVNRTVQIWDAVTGRQRATLAGHTGWVQAVAIAPDGSWLVSVGQDRTVRIWDVATAKERATLTGHTDWVEAVAVAPDGSWLATGSRDRTVRIWDVATAKERATLTGHTGLVAAVAVAPDGSWVAGGDSLDGKVRIWDVATGQEQATFVGHTGGVRALAVAPDGTWLATGGEDGTVRIWDVATRQEQAIFVGHTDFVEAMAVAQDGTWLATGSQDGTVRIWDVATGGVRALMRLDGSVSASAWLGDHALAVGGPAGLYLFDFLKGTSKVAGAR
jgi:WD40 repeat protein